MARWCVNVKQVGEVTIAHARVYFRVLTRSFAYDYQTNWFPISLITQLEKQWVAYLFRPHSSPVHLYNGIIHPCFFAQGQLFSGTFVFLDNENSLDSPLAATNCYLEFQKGLELNETLKLIDSEIQGFSLSFTRV